MQKDMLATLDKHLAENEYFAGKFTMADISMYPDVHLHGVQDVGLDPYPNVKRWYDAVLARPAVDRGLAIGSDVPRSNLATDKDAQAVLFGQKAR